MAINPQIVVPQIQGVQLENPMTFARNALAIKQAQSEIAANELAAQQAGKFNALLAASQKPNGQPLTPDILIAAGLFKPAKELSEAQAAKTTGQKESVDLVGKAMETSARLLDTIRTPNEMIAWHEANHADPVLGPYLASRGITADQSRAKIMQVSQDPEAFNQLLLDARLGLKESRVQHFVEQNYGGGTRVLEMPKYGGPSKVVPGSDIKVTPSPNRQGVTILTPSESEYAKGAGKQAIDRDFNLYTAASNVPEALTKVNQTLSLIDQGAPITGAAAELQLNFERLGSLVTGRPNQKVEDTELLDALLGADVFPLIQQLGIGSKGLDTPAEREYLRKVIAGTIALNENTLRRMTVIRGNVQRRLAERFNSRVDSGELDRFFKATGYPKRKIEIPDMPIPASAVDRLKKSPSVQSKLQFDEVFGDGAADRVLSAGK